MRLTWLKTAIFSVILCTTSYSYCSNTNINEFFTPISQQENFYSMLLEGLVNSLNKLNLSTHETQLLKANFTSHINEVFGSLDNAEKLFNNDPQTFENKYLKLFVSIKKEVISIRTIQTTS